MANLGFVLCAAAVFSGLLYLACRLLPNERWQILATLPLRRSEEGDWEGVNFTLYGLLSAVASTLCLLVTVLLLRSIDAHPVQILLVALPVLLLCIPSAKLIAWWVEGNANTFTVGAPASPAF